MLTRSRPVTSLRPQLALLHRGRGAQQPPGPLRLAQHPGVNQRRGRRAQDDLPRVGGVFHERDLGRGRAGDDQLTMLGTDQEEGYGTGMHADRQPQAGRAGRGPDPADPAEHPAHLERRPARQGRVLLALEQQQHGVAAPLHQPRAVTERDGEQIGEDRAQDVAHLLRADRPRARQPLGQGRESGDIDKRERAVDLAVHGVRGVPEPVDDQVGHVRAQDLAVTHPVSPPKGSYWRLPVGRRASRPHHRKHRHAGSAERRSGGGELHGDVDHAPAGHARGHGPGPGEQRQRRPVVGVDDRADPAEPRGTPLHQRADQGRADAAALPLVGDGDGDVGRWPDRTGPGSAGRRRPAARARRGGSTTSTKATWCTPSTSSTSRWIIASSRSLERGQEPAPP